MKNAKLIVGVVAVVAAACLLSACGGGGGSYGGGGYSSGGSSSGGFSLGAFGGCLEVTNDLDSGRHSLILVQLRDVNTDDLLQEETVLLESGEAIDLMDLPAGEYHVVGIFDDGLSDPFLGSPDYDRVIDPVIEASIAFRHP